MTRKWKYWIGQLILDKGGQGYPDPGAKRNSNKETRVEWASQHVEAQPWH
jgi:hypothetical protein